MGLKLYCDNCHKIIKEIDHNEAMKIKGASICGKCTEVAQDILTEVKVASDEAVKEIGALKSEALKHLEDMIRKSVKKK